MLSDAGRMKCAIYNFLMRTFEGIAVLTFVASSIAAILEVSSKFQVVQSCVK